MMEDTHALGSLEAKRTSEANDSRLLLDRESVQAVSRLNHLDSVQERY